jgi:KUP system potassium uptake protein
MSEGTKDHAAAAGAHEGGHHHGSTSALALAALGVVFGDIGTSPLYALKECVNDEHGVHVTQANVYGLLSMIFWSIIMVVTVKYLTFVMRADNRGEGGILALLALVPEKLRERGTSVAPLAALVIFGAALLYGDGIITPAISVLSAIEGVEVATPAFKSYVVPLTCVILVGLFAIQSRGTAGIGKVFGPIMVLWFGTLGVLGVMFIAKNPSILNALSPLWAARFFVDHGTYSFIVLGSVVLSITGGEALYADMGHFGRTPIRIAWYGLVMPSLVLNYFGQGALLLANPKAAENPFFAMVPTGPVTIALVVLSTLATIIASQALISGAFSLTHQAVQLGYLPRFTIKYTSADAEGQIYVPGVNWGLAVACIALVLAFKESSKLAAAYGIAVTGTMGITSVVYFVVVRNKWGWSLGKALPLLILFLAFDLPFFGANLLKFFEGGFVPIIVAAFIFFVMLVWKRGKTVLSRLMSEKQPALDAYIKTLEEQEIARPQGTAVFLSAHAKGVPGILTHHVERDKALHANVVLLTVIQEHESRVDVAKSVTVESLGGGFHRVLVRTGFMQQADVPARLLDAAKLSGGELSCADVTYYLGHESFLASPKGELGAVTEGIFAFLSRNASSATAYFNLPPDRVVEVGMQVDL